MKKERLQFYLLRFKNSTLPELIYRTKHFFFIKKLKGQLENNKNPVVVPKIDIKDVKELQMPAIHGKANRRLIQKILNGKLFTLNTDIDAIRKFEDTGRNIYFDYINTNDQDLDIRAVWEPARLQHITILLHFIIQNGNQEALFKVKQISKKAVLNWIKGNPFPYGPHYISAMECGLRIPVFFYCLKVLDNLEDRDFQLILNTLYLHAWWVSKRLSLYSSLGNHTIAEANSLVFGGAVFRNTSEGMRWLSEGCGLLKKELDHQVLEDGGPAEQSFDYLRFILNLYWLSVDFLENNNLYDCRDFKVRLILAEAFLNAFQNSHGNIPSIGDSDDGCTVAPGIFPKKQRIEHQRDTNKVFKKSGYTIVTFSNNTIFLFDHGPLGMAPFFNHGHADALSVTLSKEGKEILVDPGTYRYNGVPEWRQYFKGTRAHNTVTIDGLDQAVQETSFIWSHPYKAELIKNSETDEGLFLRATHDGYARLREPVIHYRSIIIFDKLNILIKDTFAGNGIYEFEINYHLHPNSVLSKQDDGWWKINNKGIEAFIRILGEDDFISVKGRRDPLLGWYSPSWNIKYKSDTLSCTKKGISKNISFVTAVCTESSLKLEILKERLYQFEQQN